MTDKVKRIKTNLSLLKYGYHFELNILGAILCFVTGALQLIFINYVPFALMSSVFIINIACTMEISGVIKSSPKFKSFYFGIQRIVNIVGCLLYFTILFVIKFIQAGSFEKLQLVMGNELVIAGIFYIIVIFYMSLAFKIFFVTTVIFFVIYFGFSYVYVAFIDNIFNFTMKQGMLIAFICVIVGMLLSEFLKRATYNRPLSKYSLGSSVRKYYF